MEFQLLDDGTLDTVVRCTCEKCGSSWETRFDGELVSSYRDENGCLRADKFFNEELFDEYCYNCLEGIDNA